MQEKQKRKKSGCREWFDIGRREGALCCDLRREVEDDERQREGREERRAAPDGCGRVNGRARDVRGRGERRERDLASEATRGADKAAQRSHAAEQRGEVHHGSRSPVTPRRINTQRSKPKHTRLAVIIADEVIL